LSRHRFGGNLPGEHTAARQRGKSPIQADPAQLPVDAGQVPEKPQRVALRPGLRAAPRAGHVVRVDGHARRDGVLNNSATSGRGSARRQRRATSSWG